MLRVGRRIYDRNGKFVDPSFEGFTSILCLTKSSPYGDIGPYCLLNEKGHNMENIWQFSKVYEVVPKTIERYSRYDSTIIWQHPEEIHYKDGKLNEAYKIWRQKGFNNKYHVRYPIGFKNKSKCLFAIKENDDGTLDETKKLNYIEARKEIYLPVYSKLVKPHKKFKELENRLKRGENLLIIEVDGPHQESIDYYKNTYNVSDDFIVNNTILITRENMNIMLNDEKHPFGHGYCLAMALFGKEKEWLSKQEILDNKETDTKNEFDQFIDTLKILKLFTINSNFPLKYDQIVLETKQKYNLPETLDKFKNYFSAKTWYEILEFDTSKWYISKDLCIEAVKKLNKNKEKISYTKYKEFRKLDKKLPPFPSLLYMNFSGIEQEFNNSKTIKVLGKKKKIE
jgi:hypothetical protein